MSENRPAAEKYKLPATRRYKSNNEGCEVMSNGAMDSATGPDPVQYSVDEPSYSKGYTHYILGVLTVVYVFNFIDRQIFAILAQSIKADLQLSDIEIGALSGVAFGIFYATLGIPIARLADRYSRVNIVAISLVIWSVMTTLQGFALNLWQLAVARIGVGVGEAGGSPPSHSILADYFAPQERASVMGVYALGIPIGILFGNLAGGWINEFFGWRNAFMVVGIPGVILAVVLKMTVKEPPRGHSEGRVSQPEQQQPSFPSVIKTMWGFGTFRHLSIGAGTQAFVGYATIAWMPAFLERTHGMSSGEVGTALGLIIGIFGGIGTFCGGRWADRLAQKDRRWLMWLAALSFLIATPFMIAALLVGNLYLSLAAYAAPALLVNIYAGATFGTNQTLAPPAMRAAAAALLLFIINIIGLVFGPTTVGVISDYLQASQAMNDIDSLRYALVACSFVYVISAFNYYCAGRHIREDFTAVEANIT
jgi:MFS family permease